MNKINILDDLTINKIAAGEVVERPSSIVKELVENSIDSCANKISIEIVDGGKKLIRITDNGCGIDSSQVDKSFLRHATSKIQKIDDLYELYSLGFRGEALASICSISKLEMITKTKDEHIGTKIIVEGGKVISKEPVGCSNGTSIIIKDIFFNTPVRQKFLKSNHAETISISDLINKLAIGNPKVQFKYINNSRSMLNSPGDGNLISVIRSIYGKDICENLININYKCNEFTLNGYIGNNNIYRSNKNLQHIYINKRFVKSKIILDAISEAYKGIIPINKHSICFLDIKISPSSIDVNIHPTKLEIKFENEKEIYIQVRDLIKRTLLNSQLIGKYQVYDNIQIKNNKKDKDNSTIENKSLKILVKNGSKEIEIKNPKVNLDNIKIDKIDIVDIKSEKPTNDFLSVDDILNNKVKIKQNDNHKPSIDNNTGKKENYSYKGNIDVKNDFIKENSKSIYEKLDYNKEINLQKNLENNIIKTTLQQEFFNENTKISLLDYKVLGTLFDTYIVMSKENAMYLLDQHAAHEKILYEKYMNKFYKSDISMQILLNPILLELSNIDMLKVEKNLGLFIKFGFEIEIFGNNHIMIRCVPNMFGVPESEKFLIQIIDNIEDIENNYELKKEKFASMACRSAIKANDKIKKIEINSLLNQIQLCENPFTCPHGRPILVEISKKEIEKMFKRIM